MRIAIRSGDEDFHRGFMNLIGRRYILEAMHLKHQNSRSRRWTMAVCCALAAGAAILAGCNTSSNPSPGYCGTPSGPLALAYPAPDSTGIPDNFIGIVFATQPALPSSYQALILPSGASGFVPFQLVGPAPVPLPSPFATPSFRNPVYQTSASNGFILPAHSLISVYLNDANSNCMASYVASFTSR